MFLSGNQKGGILLILRYFKILHLPWNIFVIKKVWNSVIPFYHIKKQLQNQNCKCLPCLWFWLLVNRSTNLVNNFLLQNCLFGATNIVKISDKNKYVYSGYGRALDGAGSWSFLMSLLRIV